MTEPKIHFIMSDNRELSDDKNLYHNLCTFANYEACKHFGYEFNYYIPYLNSRIKHPANILHNCIGTQNNIRHVSWSKILICLHHLKNNNCDYLIYCDSDCFLIKQKHILDHLKNYNFNSDAFFVNDIPWHHPDMPCGGFFVLKNNPNTIKFLNDWWLHPAGYLDTGHPWEQQALRNILKNHSIMVEPLPYRHFVSAARQFSSWKDCEDIPPHQIHNGLCYHMAKCFFGFDPRKHLNAIKELISKHYNLDDFNVNEYMKYVQKFDTDQDDKELIDKITIRLI